MPVEISQELLDTAEWDEINSAYSSNQGEMNQKRLRLLSAENKQLVNKGIVDKSLQGDIQKQSKYMVDYGGISRFAGLDADLKSVDYTKAIVDASYPIKTEKIKVDTSITNSLPKEEELVKMSHRDLQTLRNKYSSDKDKNTYLAPFEHRAYAREAVTDNPSLAPLFAGLLIPGYQLGKAIGIDLSATEDKATPASVEQLKQGYIGVGEGLKKQISPELLKMFE